MEANTWRILLIDDDRDDHFLVREMLAEAKQGKFLLTWASSFNGGKQILQTMVYDAVLVDYDLGADSGLDLIREVAGAGYPAPMILLTGRGSYETDLQAMQAGAADYLDKSEITPSFLERSIRYAIERKRSQASLAEAKQRLETAYQELEEKVIQQHLAEQALRESEAQERLLFESMLQGLVYQNQDGAIIRMNPAAERILGYSYEELLGLTSKDLEANTIRADGMPYPGHEHPAMIALHTGQKVSGVLMGVYNLREQRQRWIRISAVPLFRPGEARPYQVYTLFDDITEQRKMEELALQGELRFRIALSSAPIFVFTMDCDLRYTWVHNPQFGFTHEQMLNKRDDDLYPPEIAERQMNIKRQVIESRQGIQQEIKEWHNENWIYLYVNYEPLFDSSGKVSGLAGATLDITQQRRLEERQAEFAMQLEVQRRLIEQREMERLDIAQDLHDGVLQELTALGFSIASAMAIDRKEDRIARLTQSQQLLQQQAREIRAFCNELRPPALAPFGLERAIQSHIHDFKERHPGLHIHLELASDKQLLPEHTRMALFRMYQEALNNVVRHANASDVWVRLALDEEAARLEVEDNGMGFRIPQDWVEQARSGHLGLVGMRERALAINGQIEFTSEPGKGASVRVTVPRTNKTNAL